MRIKAAGHILGAQSSAGHSTYSNMKFLIISCLVAVAAADVSHVLPGKDANAQILRQETDNSPDGSYTWSFEADNGISVQAAGQLKGTGDEQAVVSQGQAAWSSPEGEKVQLQYVADENGYQPQGSHLPTPPPIPEAILKALEYIRAHPPAPEKN